MSTVTCVKAGTCQSTPDLVCWDLFPHLELPSGVSKRPQNAINWVYVAINSPGGFKIVKVEMKYLKLLAFTMPAHCAVSQSDAGELDAFASQNQLEQILSTSSNLLHPDFRIFAFSSHLWTMMTARASWGSSPHSPPFHSTGVVAVSPLQSLKAIVVEPLLPPAL